MIVFFLMIGMIVLCTSVFITGKVFDKLGDKYHESIRKCNTQIYALRHPEEFQNRTLDTEYAGLTEKEIDIIICGLQNKRDRYWDISRTLSIESFFGIITGGLLISASLLLIICSIVCAVNNAPRIVEKKVNKLNMAREALEYRLESQQEIGNEYLYDDVVEFNKKIYDYKYDNNNPWISWFVPEEYAAIEMIDYKK